VPRRSPTAERHGHFPNGAGDLDGDGRVHLVARDSSGRLWNYRGNGSGGFLPRVQLGSGWGSYAIGS
jgi:hypothetical protein